MEAPLEHEPTDRHPLQDAFGLSEEEFAVLLGDGSDGRLTQLAELSLTLAGHIEPKKRAAFLRSEVPFTQLPEQHHVRRYIPLEVAAEPDGLERVIRAVRIEAARRIANKRAEGANAPVPEAKRK